MKDIDRRAKQTVRRLKIKLPDVTTKEFLEQAHKASVAIANNPADADDQAFLDSVSWLNSDEATELAKREPDVPRWRIENEKK